MNRAPSGALPVPNMGMAFVSSAQLRGTRRYILAVVIAVLADFATYGYAALLTP